MGAISGPQSIAKVYVDKHDSKEQCIVNLIDKKAIFKKLLMSLPNNHQNRNDSPYM